MLDTESSLRLKLLRFPLIVGVVFIHAYSTTINSINQAVDKTYPIIVSDFIRNLISQGITRISVPALFVISGYLFFLGFDMSAKGFLSKYKSRIGTLLIPFLIWNLFNLICTALIQKVPITGFYTPSHGSILKTYGLWDYINAMLGITRMPMTYQFWFVRDLMIMVILTPLVGIINKKLGILFLIPMFVYWMSGYCPLRAPSIDAILFFSIGSYLAIKNKSLFALDHYGWLIVPVYVIAVVADTLTFNGYIHKVGMVIGILAVLSITKHILSIDRVKQSFLQLSGCSFFVYAFHEPLMTIIKKTVYYFIYPNTAILQISLYFLIPIFTIILTVKCYGLLNRVAPKFLGMISGGR